MERARPGDRVVGVAGEGEAMNASTGEYYGHDEPSASYKWGVVIPYVTGASDAVTWRVVAWFKTRRRAEAYAVSGWAEFALCRLDRRSKGNPYETPARPRRIVYANAQYMDDCCNNR